MIGQVYLVTNDVDNKVYVGSTEALSGLSLQKRLRLHILASKYESNAGYNMKICQHIRALGEDHFNIQLLQESECIDNNELLSMETKWYNDFKNDTNYILLNERTPYTGLTKAEYLRQWRIDNNEKYKKQIKDLHEKNKDKYLAARREKIPCNGCGCLYSKNYIGKHRKKCAMVV